MLIPFGLLAMPPELLIAAGVAVVGSGGAMWATTKAGQGENSARIDRIEDRLDEEIPKIRDTLQRVDVRTARMEEKMTMMQSGG